MKLKVKQMYGHIRNVIAPVSELTINQERREFQHGGQSYIRPIKDDWSAIKNKLAFYCLERAFSKLR